MAEKLVELCAKTVARDRTDGGLAKLRYLFEAAVPTSVYSSLLAWLPLNRLLESEEDFPDNLLLEEWWQKLCQQCASKHQPLLEKLQDSLIADAVEPDYRQFLLDAYFEEVISACCDALTINDRPFALQEALGQCRHDVSHKEMLAILAHHTTELYIFWRRIPCIRDLVNADSSCLGKIKTFKIDTCECYGDNNLKCNKVITGKWVFCIAHVLYNSNVEAIHATRCCGFLTDSIESSIKDHTWETNSLALNEEADWMLDASETDGPELSMKVVDEEPPVPPYLRVRELVLLQCHARHQPGLFSGLEFLCNLEKLTIVCSLTRNIIFDQIYPSVTRMLQERDLSRLRYIHLTGFKLMNIKALVTLGKYIRAASNFEKVVILERILIVQQPADSFPDPILLNLGSAQSLVSTLAISGIMTKPDSDHRSHAPVLEYLLITFNPEHLVICCDTRNLDLLAPKFPLYDSTTVKQQGKIRLKKITLVHQKLPSDERRYRRRRNLTDILNDLVMVLRSETKDIDLCVYRDEKKVINEDSCYLFKSFESLFMPVPTEDFVK